MIGGRIVCAILVTITSVSTAYGIKCYDCSSYTHPECADIKVNDTDSKFLVDCPPKDGHQMFCRKTIQTIKDETKITRVTRGCGWVMYKSNTSNCRLGDTDFKLEKSCQCFTDACNAVSPQGSPGGPLLFFSSAFSLLSLLVFHRGI